jgi:hypothetical protein
MSVTTTRQEYDDLLIDVKRNRDAVAGERRIKEETTEYLPPLSSMTCGFEELENGNQQIRKYHGLSPEGRASYNKYLSLAYFYGATGRTVDGLTGLIFSKEPVKELPANVEYLDTNADGKQTSLRKLAQTACTEAFISPQSAVLVDFPKVEGQMSVAQMEASNARPKILHYPFESIINWFYDVVNNELKLTFVVLMEEVTVRKEFEVVSEKRYRVLELIDGVYHQGVFKENGDIVVKTMPVLVNGQTSDEIPFYFIRVGAEMKSVINDLVDANLNHYRFFADYAAKEHASAFPIYYETGVQGNDNNVMIGPGSKWSTAVTDAQFGVLQTESDGGSMRTYLVDMEQRMAALGAEMLKPRIANAESAEAKSLDQVAQNSTTANVATNVSEAFTKAINFCSRWLGGQEDAIYSLNTDYNPAGMTAQQLTSLVAAWQGGAISYETFWQNLQKGEIGSADITAQEEQARINQDDVSLE